MSANNKLRTWRNSRLLFRSHDARALDIVSGRAARLGLDARHPVRLQQLDIALRRSNRIRHLHPGPHLESRGFRAAGLLQSDLIEADDRRHCRHVFAARPFLPSRSVRRNR